MEWVQANLEKARGPVQVAQFVGVLSQYAKVVGLISSQGTYKNQPTNASIRGTTNQCFFSLSLYLKFNLKKKKARTINQFLKKQSLVTPESMQKFKLR